MGGRLINDSSWKYWRYGPKMREALMAGDRFNEELRREREEKEQEKLREKRQQQLQEEAWLCWAI